MKKFRILTNQAVPGMVIEEDVYTTANQLIIPAGTTVSNKVITRLKFYSIHQITVSIKDEAVKPPTESPTPTPWMPKQEMYSEKVRKTREFKAFSSAVERSADRFHNQISAIVNKDAPIDEDALVADVSSILMYARNGMHVFDMLHSMRDFDDETYLHSVNVAMISNVLGRWLRFTRRDLDTLTLCGLLHDIGKLTMPPEVIKKPEKLTDPEYDIMMTHPLRGYNILRAQKANIHVQMTAIMHHERCDGSGYPMGIKADQIDRFAKIVMVADVYEAMTAARVYRGPLCPFEVISIFESEGLAKYDTRTVMTFLEHVNQTYLHNNVRLSDKSEGVIVMMNPTSLSRPVIQIGKEFVDLSREHNLYIEAIL
ncbi:MAG: HD-GYP domain-containing protein [Lachnospiraceae bacterium]|nr:HD-GYP domain-containing protein [Lachnospiraceae bacterium]